MKTPAFIIAILWMLWFAPRGMAEAFTDEVVREGEQVSEALSEFMDWPTGTLDLINDPVRTIGLWSVFSELPNDVYEFVLKPANMDDLNRLILRLSHIENERKTIRLHSRTEPRLLGFGYKLAEGDVGIAIFSLGSQRVLNDWFARLPFNEHGERVFGINRLDEPPKARPPTLEIFAGSPVVSLAELRIPPNVEVVGPKVNEGEQPAGLDAELIEFARFHEESRSRAEHESSDVAPVP